MSGYKLLWGVLALTLASLAGADSLDDLNNGKGQTPCCVAQQLLVPCQASISGGADCGNTLQGADVNPGSMCTCNTVVFNLWSACLEINNVATPVFNNWTSSCKSNGTSITNNDYPLHDAAKGVNIPTWAYINLKADSSFNLGAALQKTRRWSTLQIVLPIVVGVSLLVTGAALFLWYRRRAHAKLGTGGSRQSTFPSFRRPLHLSSSTQPVSSSNIRKSWAIDDFEAAIQRASLDSHDGEGGHIRLASSPSSTPKHDAHIPPGGFWRNPFKKQPVQVMSLPPRQGFRVDDTDLSSQAHDSRHPTLDGGDGAANKDPDGWSIVGTEEIFDARDDGEDERSVLLISRAPGVDFSVASESVHVMSTTTDVNIIPPSREPSIKSLRESLASPISPASPASPASPSLTLSPTSPRSLANSRTYSVESFIRPAKTDPVMLFPSAVRAAGYNGITNPYSTHSRTTSSDTELASTIPMTPLIMR